ncbi:MAG: type II methionyl aminopeptidase [Thermoplasmataceae archaeon]
MDAADKTRILNAGKLGKAALEFALTMIEPGALLLDVAEKTENFIRQEGAQPSFPLNLSINNEAAHYTPTPMDKKKFKTGDLVKVDIGAQVDGFISDNAATIEVGGKGEYSTLIDSSREALEAALRVLRPNVPINRIGKAIGDRISTFGFKPVRNLGGHGINRFDLHSRIFIPNYDDGNGATITPGSLIAIEPFASTGIGMIHNGPGGNIYIMSGTKQDKRDPVFNAFNLLPFAERWVAGLIPDHGDYMKNMMSKKQISQFPVLKEHNGAMISQAEHTILVLSDEIIVTTR